MTRAARHTRLASIALVTALAGCGDEQPAAQAAPATVEAPAAATGAGTPATTDAPERAPADGYANLQSLLRAIYGSEARLTGEWRDADGRRRHVCAQGGDPDGEPWPSLVAVCADDDDCLADGTGRIDFLALAPTRHGIRIDAQAREVASGANGCAGEVAVLRFGRARWGFVHHGGTASEGYVIGWTWLRMFRAGRLEELAAVNTVFDNNGAACEADDCREVGISINADVRFDAREPQAEAWPLLVHQSGVECFLNVDRTRRYDFDAARFRYPVPEGPPDVACPPESEP